jgi:hypothetical protein
VPAGVTFLHSVKVRWDYHFGIAFLHIELGLLRSTLPCSGIRGLPNKVWCLVGLLTADIVMITPVGKRADFLYIFEVLSVIAGQSTVVSFAQWSYIVTHVRYYI